MNERRGADDPIAAHFVNWLHRMTGCKFVQRFMVAPAGAPDGIRRPRVVYASVAVGQDTASDINQFLDGCAETEAAGVLLFPSVSSEEAIVSLAQLLAKDERWLVTHRLDPRRSLLLVSVQWRTPESKWSSAMGFAPIISMPVPRRSPYAALALWPGRARKAEQETVGFIDMPSYFGVDEHKKLIEDTSVAIGALIGENPKDAPWRTTAFGLDVRLADAFDPR